MANHPSAAKRARQSYNRKTQNRYYARTTRNAVRNVRETVDKEKAMEMLAGVSSMLDKLAKRNIIHKNKAANLKSGLKKHVSGL